MGRRARTTVVVGTASLLVGATAAFGAGSAAAEAPRAESALIGKCGGTVKGEPGTPVKVAGIKLGEIPESGSESLVGKIPAVGGLLGGLTRCTVTAVAVVSEPVSEPVQKVTEQVTKPLPDPVGSAVDSTVNSVLGEPTTQSAQSEPAQTASASQQTTQDGSSRQVAPKPPQQFGPFVPSDFNFGAIQQGVYDFGNVSYFDYSSLFNASPELFSGAGSAFGQLPSSGLFGSSADFGVPGAAPTATERDVAAAGRAQALPTHGADRVALPVLVAVLMLSGVTAALVRSWVHGAGRA